MLHADRKAGAAEFRVAADLALGQLGDLAEIDHLGVFELVGDDGVEFLFHFEVLKHVLNDRISAVEQRYTIVE